MGAIEVKGRREPVLAHRVEGTEAGGLSDELPSRRRDR